MRSTRVFGAAEATSLRKVAGRKVAGPHAAVWLSHSRGPVCTGGRRLTGPGSGQSQLPRNCLRPPECNRSREGQNPPLAKLGARGAFGKGAGAIFVSSPVGAMQDDS